MLRDTLTVVGIVAVVVIACTIMIDRYQSPVVTKAPPAPVVPGNGATETPDPVRLPDPEKRPRQAEVLIFTDMDTYTEWYQSRRSERGCNLRPPKSVDFENNQVVAMIWGDKPSGGYGMTHNATTDEESRTLISLTTWHDAKDEDPQPICPTVAVATPRGKRVHIFINGTRHTNAKGLTDFKDMHSLEYDVELSRGY